MRQTIGDWKKEWIKTNGLTNELEVIIQDSHPDDGISLYEGSFANIPDKLLEKKVIKFSQIVASSDPERNGCYLLLVLREKEY